MNTIITAYITKYALTDGIMEKQVEVCLDTCPNGSMVCVVGSSPHWCFHGEGKDWHRTKESAIARAEKMRTAKIASLRKKITKLEQMKF